MAEKKELQIKMSDQVRGKMADDPEAQKAMREFIAVLHQAHDAVQRGQYKTMDDAVEAITGNRPEPVDSDMSLDEALGLNDDDNN